MWGYNYNWSGMGNWLWGGGIFNFAVIVLVIILTTVLVIKFFRPGHTKFIKGFKEEEAIEILKKRFANGEIDEHEYRMRKDVLCSQDSNSRF